MSGISSLVKGKLKETQLDRETWVKIFKIRAKGPFLSERDFKRGEKILGGNGNENTATQFTKH